jgi:hypothetical protein
LMFSYISGEPRASKENPLRAIREMAECGADGVKSHFEAIYANSGRPLVCAGED